MDENSVKIEYRKFASFLKDYIRNMSRGELFLISDENRKAGEIFNFVIQVPGFEKLLKSSGKVKYCGSGENGEKGFGIDFVFDEESEKFLSENLRNIVLDKYGETWGAKISTLFDCRKESDKKMNIEAVILAAGKGTRMKSDLPKVMHNVAGKPMIAWIIEALKPVCGTLNVVTGHGREIVEEFIGKNFPEVGFSFQEVQNGTGGAVKAAVPNLSGKTEAVLICAGDTPLIKTETFEEVIKFFGETASDLVIVSTVLDDAGSYGRIERTENGDVAGIVEFLDADELQREIKEINSGIYLVEKNFLVEAVSKLENNNAKNEYYLTDIVKIAIDMHKKVSAYVEKDSFSLSGINDQEQLKEVEKVLLER